MSEGRAGFELKISLAVQEDGDLGAEIVFVYSISIDIQNRFQFRKASSKVTNSSMSAWSQAGWQGTEEA